MTEKFELSYEDAPPPDGLFDMRLLYRLQTIEVREEHLKHLRRLLVLDKQRLVHVDHVLNRTEPVNQYSRDHFDEWLQSLDDTSREAMQAVRLETLDHIHRVLGQAALAQSSYYYIPLHPLFVSPPDDMW